MATTIDSSSQVIFAQYLARRNRKELMKQKHQESVEDAKIALENKLEELSINHQNQVTHDEQNFLNSILMNTDKQSITTEVYKNFTNNNFIQKLAKYQFENESLLNFKTLFKDSNLSLEKMEELLHTLVAMDDEKIGNYLSDYITALTLTKAQIYILLSFLAGELYKKFKEKTKLRELLAELLKKLELQESAYLFSFFNNINKFNNNKMAEVFAKLDSYTISIQSIKQAIAFVNDAWEGDYSELVSKTLKYRMKILVDLKTVKLSFEERAQLLEYLIFEKNIIILHSTYKELLAFNEYLENTKKIVVEHVNISEALLALVNFFDLTIINVNNLLTLMKIMGYNAVNLRENIGFINVFIRCFIDKLPQSLFNDSKEQQSRLRENLRKILLTNNQSKEVGLFSFINNKKNDIKNI